MRDLDPLVGIILWLVGNVIFIVTLSMFEPEAGNWNPQFLMYDLSYLMLTLGFYKWQKSTIAPKPSSKVAEPAEQQALTADFCLNCGIKLQPDSKFCKKCGAAQT